MQSVSNLEKLVSLEERSDFSQVEYDKAKEMLLSEGVTGASPATEVNELFLPKINKEGRSDQSLLVAFLSIIPAAFSGGSVVIYLSPISVVASVFLLSLQQ